MSDMFPETEGAAILDTSNLSGPPRPFFPGAFASKEAAIAYAKATAGPERKVPERSHPRRIVVLHQCDPLSDAAPKADIIDLTLRFHTTPSKRMRMLEDAGASHRAQQAAIDDIFEREGRELAEALIAELPRGTLQHLVRVLIGKNFTPEDSDR